VRLGIRNGLETGGTPKGHRPASAGQDRDLLAELAERGGFEPGVFRKSLRCRGLWRKAFAGKDLGLSCGCGWLRLFSCVCPLAWSQFGHKRRAGITEPVQRNVGRRSNGKEGSGRNGSINRGGFKSRSPRLTPWCLRDTVARE